ncbi:TPA: hypothetical protein N0F65_004219 [Lagenidium giganteum]|uniref:BZIP domain-containing protein n=1 Tax=Lagenidium giganteum TaxID=4803 RepID=A0AAV2ZCR6_9STRA|nr:TPA: hypothetical protein N0F65_004219 [Lagenidium giganteum]
MEPAFPRRGSEDAVGVALDEASGLADAEASAQFALRPNGHISLNRLAAAPSPGSRPLPPPLPSTARRFAASSPRPVLSTAARSEPLTPIALSEQTIQSTAPLANQILPPTRSLHPRIAEVVPHPVAENEVFEPSPIVEPTAEVTQAHKRSKPKSSARSSSAAEASSSTASGEPKRRCGRKSMNYSSEQKRERNRAAVKKCRQRQALKFEYLQRKAEVLVSENQALSDMLVKNVELDEEKRRSLTRGIQMDILLKIKEIFTQSLPKDFVIDADSIWDLNSVLAVSMPSRCYYGIESIKDFWRTSLRMRNKGKIRSFWAWLFRLPPGDRFSEFTIEPFSATSNLYFVNWTTKSTPPLSGSMVIMFGLGHRVTLHVECFGWLIWRYLLTNEPFPESPMD